ncbi:hypothetical protein [uncultured Thalassolituus sp.]|uniref:hypothetical protein n=1 Tax=Thalassolituus sp. TaxID=2030822 RepID=UPI002608DF28|nr:hypothetical protein [uncultured Thalassolituus sp.]
MKLYDFRQSEEFNRLKRAMGAEDAGHFVEFDPAHQLTYGEREALSSGSLEVGAGEIRMLRDRTIALKNSRVWVEARERIHIAHCPELAQLRHDQRLLVSTRNPEKTLHICPECLAELKYQGLDGRKSRRLSDQLDELFSMDAFREDYPFYPVSG